MEKLGIRFLAIMMAMCLVIGSSSVRVYAESDTTAESVFETETEFEPEVIPETETVVEPEAETESEEVVETDADTVDETDADIVDETEVETETEAVAETESETEIEIETEAETELETEIESEIEGELSWEEAQKRGMTYAEYLDYCGTHYSYDDDAVSLMSTATITFDQLNAKEVFVSQGSDGDGSCVLSAVTSMIRRAAMLSGNTNWRSLTKAVVSAACGGSYVKHQFTVAGITVAYKSFSGTKDDLIRILEQHPEGIVIYDSKMPHGVLLTDRTDGAFYCSDPVTSYFINKGPRIKLVDSSLNRKYYSGSTISLTQIINNITGYWYVVSPTGLTVAPSMTTAKVCSVTAAPAGNQVVKLTWRAKTGASGYSIYALKDGVYAKIASVSASKTSYTDYMALDTKVNTYYVFAYAYNSKGKKYFTDKSSPASAKGICPTVGSLKATGVTGGVKLTWTKAKDAEGYLVYKRDSSGNYKLIGKTSSGKFSYVDKTASKTKNNYYKVYAYHRDGNGKVIKGRSPSPVYAKAK